MANTEAAAFANARDWQVERMVSVHGCRPCVMENPSGSAKRERTTDSMNAMH